MIEVDILCWLLFLIFSSIHNIQVLIQNYPLLLEGFRTFGSFSFFASVCDI